jgi:hypothetical protein
MPYLDSTTIGSIVVVAVVVAVAYLLLGRRLPKERNFKCAGCSAWTAHTNRTIEAWRSGRTRFYCNACHGQWLKSHPAIGSTALSRESRSGCLGVTALLIGVPMIAMISWWLYA